MRPSQGMPRQPMLAANPARVNGAENLSQGPEALHARESSGPLTGFPLPPVDASEDRGVPVATRPAKGAGRKI